MEQTIAIMMADLSGFTALTEIHGSEVAAQMIQKYVELVRSSLKGESFMLERVGDQVVAISPDPDDLALTAFRYWNIHKKRNTSLLFMPAFIMEVRWNSQDIIMVQLLT